MSADRWRRAAPVAFLSLLLLVLVGAAAQVVGPPRQAAGAADPQPIAGGTDPVIAAAGDIACDPADPNYNGGAGTSSFCRMKATSDLLVGAGLAAVLALGDNQYDFATLEAFQASYDPTWGRVKAITKPIPGNHEYLTPGAPGYYAYFGAAAGDPAKGYYSFDLGSWHVVMLNSNCDAVGGCGPASPQRQWLVADLAAHPGVCTLAAWHHPRFSSGQHGDDPVTTTFWDDLYAAGADVVLVGHDHVYERFAPQTSAGAADPLRGLRQFVVGNGGKNHTPFATVRPNSVARNADTFGVLEMTLRDHSYDWRFRPVAGGTFADAGTAVCHSAPPGFHPVPPCRLADTRNAAGPSGGPALAANTVRAFPVAGRCGVPEGVSAVAVNLTVVAPTAGGNLRLFPAGVAAPNASAINFQAGNTRANNAVVPLGAGGQVAVQCDMPGGATHFLLDVNGYFR